MDVEDTIREYGYVNFKTKKEEWSDYELGDGTIIRIKAVPLKFLKTGTDYPLNSTVLMAPFSPPELKGAPTIPPPTNPKEALDQPDMKFDTMNEPWNEYELEDDVTISVKIIVTSVSSTFIHDPAGEPVYFVNHQIITKRNPPI